MILFLIDQFINANLYFGFNVKFRHISMLAYISHVRFKIDILNLILTLYNLRIVVNLYVNYI